MAQLTYLEIVNKVLKKLREDTVTSVDYNTYSSLIGEFVNDAKREVEDAWLWEVLKKPVAFTTETSTNIYDVSQDSTLTTSGTLTNERSQLAYDKDGLPIAYETTTNEAQQLYELSHNEVIKSYALDNGANEVETTPTRFAVRMVPSTNDGYSIVFEQYPEVGRSYNFTFYTPQNELEEDTDLLEVPWHPVVDLALIYALDERGEEIGEPGSKAWLRYQTSLATAIAKDAAKDSYKITFSVP